MPMPYYVSPEQLMKDKADYARKGIARGKSVDRRSSTPTGSSSSPRTRRRRCTRSRRSTTASRSPASGSSTSSSSCASAASGSSTSRATSYSREDVTAKALANAYSPDAREHLHVRGRSPTSARSWSPRSGDSQATNEIFHILYDGSVTDRDGLGRDGRAGRGLWART